MEESEFKNREKQFVRTILFVILVIGSVFFLFKLHTTMQGHGSGNDTILYIWGLRRGIHAVGGYLIFISIVFGINSLLIKKD